MNSVAKSAVAFIRHSQNASFHYKESRFPAPKKRKAAALDGIDDKEESRFPAPKKCKAAALDGIIMSARNMRAS